MSAFLLEPTAPGNEGTTVLPNNDSHGQPTRRHIPEVSNLKNLLHA
jgi:hypothetical protein